MKGLNCYAGFWNEPGFEKFPILNRGKSNFLKPVTPRFSQQGSFIQLTVAVHGCWTLTPRSSAVLATLYFTALHILRNGFARLKVTSGSVLLRASRFLGKHGDN